MRRWRRSPPPSRPSGSRWKAWRTSADTLKPFVIAEIVEATRHPNADKLQACRVNAGGGGALRGLRRAECAHRPARGARTAGRLRAGQRHHAEGGRDPRREVRGHAHQLPRAGAGWAMPTASSSCPATRPSARATPNGPGWMSRSSRSPSPPTGAMRSSIRGVARDLAAAGLGGLKPVRSAGHRGLRRFGRSPGRTNSPRPARGFWAAPCAGVKNGAEPGLAEAAAGNHRAAADQRAGRYHQFLHL